MNTTLLTLPVRHKRDVVLLRKRTRQIARLVGLGLRDQVILCCAVFETASQALPDVGRIEVAFELGDRTLEVRFQPAPQGSLPASRFLDRFPCLEKPLPEALPASRDDLPWMIRQIALRTALDPFEELQQQNQEMLNLLLEMRLIEEGSGQPAAAPRSATAA
jgi:hypothetical protein